MRSLILLRCIHWNSAEATYRILGADEFHLRGLLLPGSLIGEKPSKVLVHTHVARGRSSREEAMGLVSISFARRSFILPSWGKEHRSEATIRGDFVNRKS